MGQSQGKQGGLEKGKYVLLREEKSCSYGDIVVYQHRDSRQKVFEKRVRVAKDERVENVQCKATARYS